LAVSEGKPKLVTENSSKNTHYFGELVFRFYIMQDILKRGELLFLSHLCYARKLSISLSLNLQHYKTRRSQVAFVKTWSQTN